MSTLKQILPTINGKGMETGIIGSLFFDNGSFLLCVTDIENQIKHCESTRTGERTN